MDKVKEIQEEIIKYFKDRGVEGVYIFGSLVRDELRDSSDIDIAVLGKLNFKDRIKYSADLEEIVGRKIDIIDFYQVDLNFQAEIITSGRMIYCRDVDEISFLEMKVLGNYLTLEEDRKVVIEAIYERGSVF